MTHSATDSNRLAIGGQSATVRWRVWAVVWRLFLASVCLGATGCNSIFHRAWTTLPAEPERQLKMRTEEAQAAECLATQAATKLLADLKSGMGGELIQADFDRLEMLARELQRRVLAARDVIRATQADARLVTEIERLQGRSECWLGYVQSNRYEDLATQVQRLDRALLDSPGEPASPTH